MKRSWIRTLAVAAVALSGATGAQAQTPPDSTPPSAQPAAQARPLAVSWTSDRSTYVVGDILTILVDELTIASADKTDANEQNRDTRARFEAAFKASGTSSGGGATFGTGWDASSRARGQARRQDRFTTEFSVRVIEIEPSGVLKIEGTRTLLLDGQEQQVTLTGFLRPQDVSTTNLVDSWRVADANFAYSSTGDLGKPKQSILSRIIGIIWP
jgi:flagellar L-ring protein precursor FlgH